MSPKLCLGALLGVASLSAATAPAIPPKLPVEDFSRFRIASGVSVSGDGKAVAFQAGNSEHWTFSICDWETGKTLASENQAADVSTPIWLNDDVASNGAGALDRRKNTDRNNFYWLYSREFFAARFAGRGADEAVTVDSQRDPITPDVVRLNTRTGAVLETTETPRNATALLVDGSGFLKVAVQRDKKTTLSRVVFRTDKNGKWLVVPGMEYARDKVRAEWLSADGKLLYFSQLTPEGTWGLYTYDLVKLQVKDPILSHTKYDILTSGGPVMAPRTREILGFYYHTDKPRAIWFDPQMAAIQDALDANLPNRSNKITSLSDDLQRMIILSSSARDPGTFYRFDLGKKELKPLFPILPWIKPQQMAESYPISYVSRDGLPIHGYLTVPLGREPKNLPLIVVPHANPWSRDIWAFDSDVQFLANRGYAVLQVNHRGSSGYGQSFQEKGYRRLGREVQNDITDGARWVISQGIADPRRVAIMGYGYGGFSALLGTEQNPGLYCCAISISSTTNLIKRKKDFVDYELYKEQFGDVEADAVELADQSPVNHVDKIDVPLLLVYDASEDDYVAIRDDFNDFTKALKRAHKSYETLDKHGEFEGMYTRKNRIELLRRLEKFLADHVPTDVSAQPAAPAPH